jgi:ABC-type multidrug transport system fused ATPase/permease subunit
MMIFKKYILLFGKKDRKRMLFILFLMTIGMVLEVFSIGVIVPVVSILSDPTSLDGYPVLKSWIGKDVFLMDQKNLFIIGILILISAYSIKTVFLIFLYWKQSKFIYDSQANTSLRLFSLYMSKPYNFHMQKNSAQLIRNVINETTQFANGSVNTGLTLVTEIMVIFGVITLLVIIEPMGAITIGLTLILTGLFFYFSTRAFILKMGRSRQKNEGYRIQHVQQGLSGIKDIKLLNREDFFIKRFYLNNREFADAAQKQSFLLSIPRLGIELIAILALGILSLLIMSKGGTTSSLIPIIAMFGAAAFRLMPSVNRILGNWQTFRYNQPVVEMLYEELKGTTELVNNQITRKIKFNHSIQLKGVSFSYNKDKHTVVDNINIKINKNSSIGFIGESGAGKSTLLDLVLGLIEPTSGKILVDSKNIHSNINEWQNNIGYVPQTIYLTDDTLRNNIAFGIEYNDIDDNMVNKAIKLSQLEGFVSDLECGLDTFVGEGGVRLSGGQKQRIGIARALYHDPNVLILDEATSALNHEIEKEVMEAINFLCGKKTLLIIAHRLSTVSNCDYLYKLDKGKVVASGTPNELINV